jgi:transposase
MMKTDKLMSQKEVKRAGILTLLKDGKLTQQEAASLMGIGTRQVRRLIVRYRQDGLSGLISKRRGGVSNRALDGELCAQAISLIGTHYRDFGPTLACEKLSERHQLHLSVESTRQLMIKADYWHPKKGSKIVTHPMRERRARFGEMIQIDGSPHDWFEGRGKYCTLLVFIDDATGQLTQLHFVPTETTLNYMQVLHDHILAHGIPVALYSDRHSIFRINAKQTDPDAETQFSRAARELGITCIHAHSPQAKGRVERANQTLQDRLVKEMRLAGINDMDSANTWLPSYLADYNQRFAVSAQDQTDAHVVYAGTPAQLRSELSVQITRTLSKNLSCQYANELMQVQTTGTGLALRGAKVTVHEHFDGTRELLWKKRKLTFSVMDKPPRQAEVADGKSVNIQVDQSLARRNISHKPAANHPWRNKPANNLQHASP